MHLPHQTVTLLDAPGHRDFISNMITGGIQADCGLLVVSAAKGEFEAGMSPAGITKDHLLILRGNGVETLGILVNKMDDALWNRERFDEIRNQLIPYLKHLGVKKNQVQ